MLYPRFNKCLVYNKLTWLSVFVATVHMTHKSYWFMFLPYWCHKYSWILLFNLIFMFFVSSKIWYNTTNNGKWVISQGSHLKSAYRSNSSYDVQFYLYHNYSWICLFNLIFSIIMMYNSLQVDLWDGHSLG